MGAPAADDADADAAPNAPVEALAEVAADAVLARFADFGLLAAAAALFIESLLAALSKCVCSEAELNGIMSHAKRYLRSGLNAMSISM